MTEQLNRLERKRGPERSNYPRLSSSIYSFTEQNALEDYEHYKGRLEETLEHMFKIDDTIHDLVTH